MKKFLEFVTILVIFIAAVFLRVYKLDQIPPSLNWDEVAAGYNAYTIANWGVDEWGHKFPLVFQSFYDDKHPVHIYIAAAFIKVFGLSDFVTRLPSAVFGSLTVLAIYFLVRLMFKNRLAGIFSALFLAISSYHLQFSRGLWEVTFALFFYILGLLLFYIGIRKKTWLLPLSFFSFGICFFSYHASKVLVPPTLLLLGILYFKDLVKNRISLLLCGLVILLFAGLTIQNPRILGFARIAQNKLSNVEIDGTFIYPRTHNIYLATAEVTLDHYVTYFSPKYLFVSGDQDPRDSVPVFGQFYKIYAVLIAIGLISLIFIRSKEVLIILAWLLLAPLPAAFTTGEAQNATRAMFMMGSVDILAALGASRFVMLIKNEIWYILASLIIIIPLFTEFGMYLRYYYTEYAKKDAIAWQYGMKQIAMYIKDNPNYWRVYMTKDRQQPYIFLLYYLKYPVYEYLNTVKYDESQSKSYNVAESFGDFQFSNWDPIESPPTPYTLYVLTPSEYDGLRYRSDFDIKDLIKYPDGSNAYFIVESK